MPFEGLTNGSVSRAVLFDHTGKEILPKLDADDRFDGLDAPHVLTFGSLYMGAAWTYNHLWDEAMRHSRQNALAMRRDAWLMSLLRERADETLSKDWHLEPDNPKDPWQKTVADGVTKIVRGIPHFQKLRRYLLEGQLWYGRFAANCKWKWKDMKLPVMKRSMSEPQEYATGKVLTIVKHKPVNGDKVNFHADDTPYVLINQAYQDRLRGETKIIYPSNANGPALLLRGTWSEKILVHIGPDIDDADYFDAEMAAGVFGVGLRHRLYWLDFLRRDYFGAVTEMLNRIGLGLVVIKYDQSNDSAKQEAIQVAKKFSRRSVITIPVSPDGMSNKGAIEVIETPTAGALVMLELQKHVEDQIERFAVGQVISGGGGTSNPLEGTGRSEFAKDTKTKLCKGDADNEDNNLTGSDEQPGIIGIIKKYTYSFADFPLRFCTDHEVERSSDVLEGVKTCVDMGIAFPEDPVRELTGVRAPEEGEVTIGGKEQLAMQMEADKANAFGGENQPEDVEKKPEEFGMSELSVNTETVEEVDYADDYPVIPYHVDLTLSVSNLIDRIRVLGVNAESREYIRRLRNMLRTNPQLKRKLNARDVAFVSTIAGPS